MSDAGVRPANRGDVAEIVTIEREAFPHPWKREFFEIEMASPGRYCRVAVNGDRITGYVFAMYVFDEMHVNKIAVLPEYRRRGIARALMNDCLSFAHENAITSISLEVRESNESARAFYRMIDFEDSYVRPRYYPDGEAAVVMMRKLTS